MSANVNVNSVSNSNVTKMKPGRLPEVKLTVFKGDFEEWENFWSSFRANVDARDDLKGLPSSSTWLSLSRVSPRR